MDKGYRYPQNRASPGRGLSLREKIQYSLLGIVVVGSATFLGTRMVKKAIATQEQNKTLDEGSAPAIAKQIKMAFDNDGWWGTDKESLRAAIRAIPTKRELRKVMVSYKKLYGGSLLADMQSELKSTEYQEMLSIVSVKPESSETGISLQVTQGQLQGWAKRLKAAFDIYYGIFPGTDEPAIKAVFIEIPSQSVYLNVAATYKQLYGSGLEDDLKSELEFWEYAPMMGLIENKPKN
jgi:hypothetical protein